jgi:hypothetical protein
MDHEAVGVSAYFPITVVLHIVTKKIYMCGTDRQDTVFIYTLGMMELATDGASS